MLFFTFQFSDMLFNNFFQMLSLGLPNLHQIYFKIYTNTFFKILQQYYNNIKIIVILGKFAHEICHLCLLVNSIIVPVMMLFFVHIFYVQKCYLDNQINNEVCMKKIQTIIIFYTYIHDHRGSGQVEDAIPLWRVVHSRIPAKPFSI